VESAAFADLVGLVEACLPPGADSIRAALMVWTGMHGRVSLQPVMPRFPFPPADEFVDALLGAFVPRADG
jgi:hypothetical protein